MPSLANVTPQPAAMAAASRAETKFTICQAPRNRAACGPKNREAA